MVAPVIGPKVVEVRLEGGEVANCFQVGPTFISGQPNVVFREPGGNVVAGVGGVLPTNEAVGEGGETANYAGIIGQVL